MSDFYPRARGRMLEVWAKLECPVCDADMEHVTDEYEGKLHLDTYACDYCHLLVTYVSPRKYHEYHQVPDNEKRYFVERQLG